MNLNKQTANPWADLPNVPPYVLPTDMSALSTMPTLRAALHLECPPVPWVGRPLDARVILLTLNPGYVPDVSERDNDLAGYLDANIASLTFRSEPPVWCVAARFAESSGYDYWTNRILRQLIAEVGIDAVAARVAWLEFFPYHSETGDRIPTTPCLPSQRYTFELLREAIRRAVPIVVLRSWNAWSHAVPELVDYVLATRTRNPRNPTVSRRNLTPEAFANLVETLR